MNRQIHIISFCAETLGKKVRKGHAHSLKVNEPNRISGDRPPDLVRQGLLSRNSGYFSQNDESVILESAQSSELSQLLDKDAPQVPCRVSAGGCYDLDLLLKTQK